MTGRYLATGVAMQQVRRETWVAFERRLDRAGVPVPQRPDYRKWVRFYLDFCHKYGHPPRAPTSLESFVTKLVGATRHSNPRLQQLRRSRSDPDGKFNLETSPLARRPSFR